MNQNLTESVSTVTGVAFVMSLSENDTKGSYLNFTQDLLYLVQLSDQF